jgi:hypothetical protein
VNGIKNSSTFFETGGSECWGAVFVRDVDKSWQKLKMEGSRMQLAFVPEGRQRDA